MVVKVRAQNSGFVGPKAYYLALGDSLAYGYQPNFNWSNGYVQQWYSNLKTHGTTSLTNYGCPDESSATFINGGCPYAILVHNYHAGSQLSAALSFLSKHSGKVSPVTLDIGANDVLPDINSSTCVISTTWTNDLATLDHNLTTTILPQLKAALTVGGQLTGDLILMNYYDPYQNQCPNSVPDLQMLNAHLAADAASFGVPVDDVFSAFGGATTPNPNICTFTWICNATYHDIHATTTGYGIIAGSFESLAGY